jgi:hypothetical protein
MKPMTVEEEKLCRSMKENDYHVAVTGNERAEKGYS